MILSSLREDGQGLGSILLWKLGMEMTLWLVSFMGSEWTALLLFCLIIFMCRKLNFWVMQVNKVVIVTSSGNGKHNIIQVLSLALTCTPKRPHYVQGQETTSKWKLELDSTMWWGQRAKIKHSSQPPSLCSMNNIRNMPMNSYLHCLASGDTNTSHCAMTTEIIPAISQHQN